MEKRILQLIGAALAAFFTAATPYAQEQTVDTKIRLHGWAELDAYPELKEAADMSTGQFDFPISRIRAITPFLMEGMIYGWEFTYTPYDKLRGVKEFFEVSPIQKLSAKDNPITYESPWIQENLFHCWAEYKRTSDQAWQYKQWQSLYTQKIRGRGYGKVQHGFDGITEAAQDALKNAVREHYRHLEKNKPKEISGKVIINREPKIGITEGRYAIELDFFVETDRIIKYSSF